MKNLLNSLFLLLFCCITTKSFGQATTLAGGNTGTSNIGPSINNATPAVSNPVASFSLVQSGSNANLTQVVFTTSGTYSASTDITAFTLYVNTTANSVNGSSLVTSATVTATAAGTQIINLSTPFSLSAGVPPYYFFIIPTFGSSPVSGNTIAISSISSSNISVSTGSVSGSAAATGTLTILNPTVTGTTSGSRCSPGTIALSATPSAGAAINWFDAFTGGTNVGSGTSFTTPSISSTAVYYPEASQNVTIQTGTLSDNTTNLAGPYQYDQRTDLHYFSSTNACVINSIDIYPYSAGNVIIVMKDGSGTVVATSATTVISSGQISNTVPVTIPVGFSVPAGATNYQLGGDASFDATTEAMIYRGAANSSYGPYPTGINGFSQVGDAGGNSTATGVSGPYSGYGARCYFYNWNVTVSASGSPRASAVATINTPPVPTFTASAGANSCINSNVIYTTQPGQSSYIWTVSGTLGSDYSVTAGGTGSASNTATIKWLTTGSRTVTVNYSSSGCAGTTAASSTTSVNPLPVPSFTSSPSANTCDSSSVTYTTQAGQSSYSWSVPGVSGSDYSITSGGTGSASNTATLTWLTTGSKNVTVNYATAGCTGASPASNTTTVNPLPVPTFTVSPGANTCVNSSVTYSTQAGQSPYTWSVPGTSGTDYNITLGGIGSASNTVSLTWLTTGSKAVTVNYTNANGCTGSSPVSATTSVNPLPVPAFSAAPGPGICLNSSVAYTTLAGQSSYSWSVPGVSGTDYSITSGGTGSASNTVTLTWLTTGSKTVTVNYATTGCSGISPASSTTTVNPLPAPTFTVSPGPNTCANSSVTYATQAGQSSYSWIVPGLSGTDYTITSGGTGSANTVTLTWLTPGIKTVTVNYTNSNGCTGAGPTSSTTTVNPLPIPTFTTFPGANTCANSSVTYTTQPGELSYNWTVPGVSGTDYTITSGGTGSTNSTVTLTWMTPGSKTATVSYTNINGCIGAAPASNTTTVNPLPIPTFTAAPSANICPNNSATYTTQAGKSSYSWSVAGVPGSDYNITSGGTGSTDNTVTLTWLTPGSKTVTVNYLDIKGCTGTNPASNTILINPLPAAIAGASQVCVAGAITLTDDTTGGTWMGSNAAVLVNSASGMVTGVSADTATIVYTLPTGCASSAIVTVNPLPSAISGNSSVCVGSQTTLSDAGGGSWGSSNTALATIDAGSGTAGGVSNGSPTITFTLPTGCFTTTSLTVNPLPSAISGITNVCTGATTNLSDPDAGGTWISSIPFYAAVGFTSGLVTGLNAGTTTITYTLPTGCITTIGLIVNPAPSAISGSSAVCVGSSTTLGDVDGGGSWSTSDASLASVIGGVVTGIAPGSPTITYTLPTGCFITKSIAVNQLPSAIAGTNNVCTGATISLTDPVAGGTWSSSNTANATVGGTGVVTGVTAGTVNITYTLVTGCKATTPITVNTVAPITGVMNVCTGATTSLSNAIGGGTWSSSDLASATVDMLTGSVTGIVAGLPTIIYTSLNGCVKTTIVTVNATPADHPITGGGNICAGSTGAPIVLSGSSAGVSYQLFNGATGVGLPLAGTGGALNFGLHAAGGLYTVIATNPTTGCFATMSRTAPIVVEPLPAVHTVTGGGSYCAGTGGLHVGLDGSDAGISYQLYHGITHVGTPISGTGLPLDFGVLTTDEVYTVIAINDTTSCTNNMAGIATVITNVLPTPYTVTGGGNYCAGGTGLVVGLSASNPGINYQLYKDGSALGPLVPGGTGAINFGLHSVAGAYTVKAINGATGCANDMSGTAVIVVTPVVIPSVTLSTGVGDTLCSGLFATVTAIATNGGTAPVYNWSVNGSLRIGASGNTLHYTPADGDIVSVVLNSSATCATPPTATASLGLTVLTRGEPRATVSADPGNAVCSGTLVNFTNITVYGGLPTYTWFVNGISRSTDPFYSYIPVNGDDVYVQLVSNYFCRTADTVPSNHIVMTVQNQVAPTVTISADPTNNIGRGETATLIATVANGGPAPTFQWYVNNIPVLGENASSFTRSNFRDLDAVSCHVLTSGICAGQSGVGSITMHVSNVGVAAVGINGGEISLLPNPNKGTFTVKGSLGSSVDAEVSLVVTDMLGQVIYRNTITAQNGILNEQVTLNNNLANGLYLLNVRSGNESAVFHFVMEK